MDYKTADRLIELRKKNGYSQEELAERLNVSRQAVSKWERAESLPDTENLIALSRLYSVSLDELINGQQQNSYQQNSYQQNAQNTQNANQQNPYQNTQNTQNANQQNTYQNAQNNQNANQQNPYSKSIVIPINRKTALNILTFLFLGLGILFIMIGSATYFGLTFPETQDLRLAQNQSIEPVTALVVDKVKTSAKINYEYQYSVYFEWTDGQGQRKQKTNGAYSQSEAEALIGKNVLIRVDGTRAVLVDYQRSLRSTLGYIFIGVFGGLGVIFLAGFGIVFGVNKKLDAKQQSRITINN